MTEVAGWIKFIAQDEDGEWWGYAEKPVAVITMGQWACSKEDKSRTFTQLYHCELETDAVWYKTLIDIEALEEVHDL